MRPSAGETEKPLRATGRPRLNLANRITMLRLVFAVVAFAFLLLIQEKAIAGSWRPVAAWIALVFFVIATASDALDGYLARRDNTVTAFGRIADPVVDKAIVCGSLIFLTAIDETRAYLAPWMVVVILVREFLVNGIRGYMESIGVNFQAELPGKVKMVVQSLAIGFLIGILAFEHDPAWLRVLTHVLVWSTIVLTFWSGIGYVAKALQSLGPRDL